MDIPSAELVKRYAAGDSQAATEIHRRYAARLIGFARRMLADRLAARIDPEDVVQSVYRSFFIRSASGALELRRSGDLWRVLAAMTRHKLLHAVEKATADKRTPTIGALPAHSDVDEASHEEVVAVADELAAIMEQLDADERMLLEMQLRDASMDDMAVSLGKSRRTIRRMLLALRGLFERRLELAGPAPLHPSVAPLEMVAPLDYRQFTLERLIGAGGFGKVYRAEQRTTGEIVAIKVLRKKLLLDRRAVAQFISEAKIISALSHPGIICVHGMGGTPGGGYFLVLDWHARGDLGAVQNLSLERAVDFVAQAADAIAHAHTRNIVHCDLKPSNLLLADNDRIVVSDFGFAVALMRASDEPAGALGGTKGFTAPELIAGGSPAPVCDVFSLGRIMHHLLSQSAADPSAARRFGSLIDLASHVNPSRRIPNAAEFARQLKELKSSLSLT